jgi:hypothetical protein
LNTVRVLNNRVIDNLGNEPEIAHGGAFYLFAHTLTVSGNLFMDNRVTGWGAGLYVGAYTGGGQFTTARDRYTVTNAIFRGNGTGRDFAAACGVGCANIAVSVAYSMVQTKYANGGVKVNFGAGIVRPAMCPIR